MHAYHYLGGTTGLVKLARGQLLYVDTRDQSLTPHLMASGVWEPEVEACLRDQLAPGDWAVEVGANLGYFTTLFADRVGGEGRVDAFEANPLIVPILRRSIAVNGLDDRTAVHPMAAGDRDGTASFFTSETHYGAGYLSPDPQAGTTSCGSGSDGPLGRLLDEQPEADRPALLRSLGSLSPAAIAWLDAGIAAGRLSGVEALAMLNRLSRAFNGWGGLGKLLRETIARSMGYRGPVRDGLFAVWIGEDPDARWPAYVEATLRYLAENDGSPVFAAHSVHIARLDDILGPIDRPLKLLKIDAEGAEPLIIRGAAELLRRSPDARLCLEWSAAGLRAMGHDLGAFSQLLAEMGFAARRITAGGLEPVRMSELADLPHCDILFARR